MAFLAAIPLTAVLTGASAAVSAVGTIAGANAAASASKYQAQVAQNNALVADWNARQTVKDQEVAEENAKRAGYAGQERAQQQDRAAAEQIGEVIAGQAASGVRGASPQRVLATMRELAGMDRQQIRREGDSEAGAFRGQARALEVERANLQGRAQVLRSDAGMLRRDAGIQRTAGYLGAGGTLLGGFADAYGKMQGGATNPLSRRGFSDANKFRASGYRGGLI